MLALLASIPSPGSKSISLGPLELRAYGVMIALGVIAAVWLAGRRWVARGGGPDDMGSIALWAVPAGLIGARLYHVITDWRSFEGRWGDVVKVWEGGLGIPGGMFLGVVVGVWKARQMGIDLPRIIDAAVPALPLAQAIGRLGNWFNQELFGRATDLPWAVEIDERYRPAGHLQDDTYHPAFLYESLWNLALVGFLIWLDRKKVLRPGRLLAVYVAGYAIGRLWIESLRVDFASKVLGLRVNIWVMGTALLVGLAFTLTGFRRDRSEDAAGDEAVPEDLPLEDDGPVTAG